jgi:hypothetical protein
VTLYHSNHCGADFTRQLDWQAEHAHF